jgi:hypothetical protein
MEDHNPAITNREKQALSLYPIHKYNFSGMQHMKSAVTTMFYSITALKSSEA